MEFPAKSINEAHSPALNASPEPFAYVGDAAVTGGAEHDPAKTSHKAGGKSVEVVRAL